MKWIVNSDIGLVRKENQDRAAVFSNTKIVFAIVCDGMGGHKGGSEASKTTVKTFEIEFNKNAPTSVDKLFNWFKTVLKKSKKAMIKAAGNDDKLLDMGTTVTAAFIFKETKEVYVFNVGDSRTYIYNGLLHQITVDHNLRNYYIKEAFLSEDKAANILGGSALTSALGPKKTTRVDAFQLSKDDKIQYLILTSDGIHDFILKPVFEKIIGSNKPLKDIADELIKEAIKGHSSDNCTVVVVKVDE